MPPHPLFTHRPQLRCPALDDGAVVGVVGFGGFELLPQSEERGALVGREQAEQAGGLGAGGGAAVEGRVAQVDFHNVMDQQHLHHWFVIMEYLFGFFVFLCYVIFVKNNEFKVGLNFFGCKC